MARPPRIEKLRHGRLLCGSVFRFFVETWNWLTAYVDNMRGDAETDPQSGYITIDRTDPDHPVIRFRADKVAAGGAATPVSPDDFPPPFTVRWAQSENSGQGAWVIWLPDFIVAYRNEYLRPTRCTRSQLLPRHWYIIDDARPNEDEVWLGVKMPSPPDYPTPRVEILTNGSPDESWNEVDIAYRIAQMFTGPNTSSRRVSQQIVSMIDITGAVDGGGGGGVELDGISINGNLQNQVQVHNWNTGTPESGTTLAQDLHNADGVTAQGTLVERTTGGALDYKKIGTLAQLLGSTVSKSSQKILTGLTWNTTSHKLVISSANITIANGVITAWADNADTEIATTPISNIILS